MMMRFLFRTLCFLVLPPFSFLVYMFYPPGNLLRMLRLPRLQIVMAKFPSPVFNAASLWFRVIVMIRLFCAPCFLVPPAHPMRLFALTLPCRLMMWGTVVHYGLHTIVEPEGCHTMVAPFFSSAFSPSSPNLTPKMHTMIQRDNMQVV
jgi:hypothetical protein